MLDMTSKWYQKYGKELAARGRSMQAALNLFLMRGGSTIVETGTIRFENDWGAGMSTLVIADAVKDLDVNFHSVDISEDNIKISQTITKDYKVNYHCMDSVKFLKDFEDRIHFLYLDSMDYPLGGTDEQILESQEHQLKELKACFEKLTQKSVILLDDNDLPRGGKTRLTKEFLKENGWHNIIDNQQSLWIYK